MPRVQRPSTDEGGVLMNGIDWRTIGAGTFERIVDTLLSLEFGTRGRPVDGRGGEGEVPGDYSVDEGEIIFEYKYFPAGFPSRGSQRPQIKKSFDTQKSRNPKHWILVFPSKLTPFEQKFLENLGAGTEISVGHRDRVWLDTQLSQQPHVAAYFRHQSDNDYLAEKAQAYRDNPLIRTPGELADRIRLDMAMAADADPDWGWEIATDQGSVLQTLVPRHPNAPLLSPVKLSFTGAFGADSQTGRDLQRADAFGYTKPITIPGHLIRDFRVSGPPIVAHEGVIDGLEIEPEAVGEWLDVDLMLTKVGGNVIGVFPGKARRTGRGTIGWTFEIAVGALINLTFRAPYASGGSGSADFAIEDPTRGRPAEVADVTDFVCQLHEAEEIHLRSTDGELASMKIAGQFNTGESLQSYIDVREIARDLVRIEQETGRRFRYPATLSVEERVMIRSLRLMLEGHCVAHPTWTQFNAEFNGKTDESLERFLIAERQWILYATETGSFTILGQQIPLKNLHFAGLLAAAQEDIDELRTAIRAGTAAGMKLQLTSRPGDRIRMFLKDRYGADKPIEITPWRLDGISQMGLTPGGQPVDVA